MVPVQPDWSQNDPESQDYIKNRTHYHESGELAEVVLLSDPELRFELYAGGFYEYYNENTDFAIVPGRTYVITIDEVEYTEVARSYAGMSVLGDGERVYDQSNAIGIEFTKPFAILAGGGWIDLLLIDSEEEIHSVTIVEMRDIGIRKELVKGDDVKFAFDSYRYVLPLYTVDADPQEGTTVFVTWDGEVFELTAKSEGTAIVVGSEDTTPFTYVVGNGYHILYDNVSRFEFPAKYIDLSVHELMEDGSYQEILSQSECEMYPEGHLLRVYGTNLGEFEIEIGKTYKINYNGTEYERVCFEFDGDAVLGNLAIDSPYEFEDTGEPFFIVYNIEYPQFLVYVPNDVEVSEVRHTFKIEGYASKIKKLDYKYLSLASEGKDGLVSAEPIDIMSLENHFPIGVDVVTNKLYYPRPDIAIRGDDSGESYLSIFRLNSSHSNITFKGANIRTNTDGILIDITGGNSEGEGLPQPSPFDADKLLMVTADDGGSSIHQWVDTLPNKHIPGYVASSDGSRETVLDTLSIEQYTAGEYTGCTFVVGDLYEVHWDGLEYHDVECYMNEGYRVLGKPDTGLPFYIDDDGGDGLYIEPNAENGTTTWSTVAIYKNGIEWKLDPSYLDLQGITPYIGENGNWFVGDEDTGVSASAGGSSNPGGSDDTSNIVYAIIDENTMTSSMSDTEIDDALYAGKTVIGVTSAGSFPLSIFRTPLGADPVTGTLFNFSSISGNGRYEAKTYVIEGNAVTVKTWWQMLPSPVGVHDAGKVATATSSGTIEWQTPPGSDSPIAIVTLDLSTMTADKTVTEIIELVAAGKSIVGISGGGLTYTCSLQSNGANGQNIQVIFHAVVMNPEVSGFGYVTFEVLSNGSLVQGEFFGLVPTMPTADDISKVLVATGERGAEWVDPSTLPGVAGGIPLPETASAGQFIMVSAVDENGVVVATEAVDAPTLPAAEGVAF